MKPRKSFTFPAAGCRQASCRVSGSSNFFRSRSQNLFICKAANQVLLGHFLPGVTDAPSYTLRALLHALSAPRRRYGHTPVEGQHSEEDEAGPSSRPLAAHQSSSPLSKAVCLSSQDCPSLHAALRILIARFRGLDIGRAPADEQELDRVSNPVFLQHARLLQSRSLLERAFVAAHIDS